MSNKIEQTLVLIKPDAIERGLEDKIIDIYIHNGLTIKKMKKIQATKELAEEHYIEHKDKPYFKELTDYIMRTPIIAMILEGEDAISRVRKINGKTNPKEAGEGTIRHMFALSKNENSVHASDSQDSANREINIWFK
ncbi:nucleoside-diphosphate kinase [Clostridium perfringens]|uniref:Nucleoside diphosphate kinase n=1 Tax=Clostridium perfringens TaxID=1502 RepID=A0A140GRU8_CLOPF|nr:nucleoside-diphosphate kinase [Clostridium perfringens]AMN31257.1 Nucleoside diphosphate kinase [Clostridium perfringens]TBX14245.1 nucleoside-diphosphate kinase [Clostridium perfringens]